MEIIEKLAFLHVMMYGVKVVHMQAFAYYRSLNKIEYDKLKIIGRSAFATCNSLRSIDMPSVEIIEEDEFNYCHEMTEAHFS